MSKTSFTTLAALVLGAAVGYLAFNPEVGQQVVDWVRGLFGGAPDTRGLTPVGYGPAIPVR